VGIGGMRIVAHQLPEAEKAHIYGVWSVDSTSKVQHHT
jgi:hypothetical protein